MVSNRLAGRLFGVFFILTFLSYGFGSVIAESVIRHANSLEFIYANQQKLVLSVILTALVHTLLNIALPVLMFPILRPYNERLALGYLVLAISATVILAIGSVFLLLLLPLSEAFVASDVSETLMFESLATLLHQANFYAYQIGMALWGVGGLLFCYLLYRSKWVPVWLIYWGVIGYSVFIIGTILELFGYPVGVMLSLPGGLFELVLSGWFITKSFATNDIELKSV